ncbi:MAG: BREX-2 system adenine-specific DNA-methyltransferase PglX [Kineosporiaceae bacterium]|nr:BREX-2 system adenine-specific DNA-methyltransferase PglX [Kineosporiaceae bacterium]MBK7624679.1 BREX-2 system adenine-specific DNA-methyltransferase PglX [Kineosporiaceae bacterium]MBK8076947.1 BREX-2 system adenine-specific DNA-methyltransferase PglX [Kineosporiaceae bacterium]
MAVSPGLTAALKKFVIELEDDLRDQVEGQPEVRAVWAQEHHEAVQRERTSMAWQVWRDDRVTQAAVAWVLTTVFIRFCEDNRLLGPVWIAGPPERRQEALDAELAYYRANPEHNDREWLLQAIEHLRSTKATRDLVESHSPLWSVSPSGRAAKRLLAFWREQASGSLVWDLTDDQLSTRFLGDLYQDLSDYAKKTFALLQTPEFVEEFILDQTMEPALLERPLEGFRLIDPTCGSGHFLLGAFARLVNRWADRAPGLEVQSRVQRALDAIHGVDLNPFAVAVARFRLLLAALQSSGLTSLEDAPAFGFNLAAGDSLLHGSSQLELDLPGMADADSSLSGFAYVSEDLALLRRILEPGRYDVVVGNPPYITVKDKKLNQAYRDRYATCKGTYALTVPFMERFFQLAKPTSGDRPAGWTGQITSNSFMKREFGSRLIEEFLSKQDLRLVVDTSGAYIPGHGTPTVILVGQPRPSSGTTVKAALGIRGEPGQPSNPAKGMVWSSIVDGVGQSEFENEYISVVSLPLVSLAKHPWSLSGGGADRLLAAVDAVDNRRLDDLVTEIGFGAVTREDSAFMIGAGAARRHGVDPDHIRPVVEGDVTRDWAIVDPVGSIWPYNPETLGAERDPSISRCLWPYRTLLSSRVAYGLSQIQRGLQWFEYSMFFTKRFALPLSITFAFVATHNHFVFDRGGKVFNRSAPVIKLPEGTTEADHLALLGVLNSSTACFWLKQNSHDKGSQGINEGLKAEAWERFYEFTGTTLKDFPLPTTLPLDRGRLLDELATRRGVIFAAATTPTSATPTTAGLDAARMATEEVRARMIAEQEELDWEVYRSYELLNADLTYADGDLPTVRLGERAFEIALARKVSADEEATTWFSRHGSAPITEIPVHWPQGYRDLVQRRLDMIESNKFIHLLERPEYKRRWSTEPWEKRVERALRSWILDRLEDRRFWFDGRGRPVARSVAQLADIVSRDAEGASVLELWSGHRDQSVTQQLSALLADESVPFLAAYRLKDTGLRKREAWEHTWDLQRREDAGETVGAIPVPPKYAPADFRKQSWWQHRGKLDVPKERFVLYPDASRETDSTQLLGWAGWDHAQQALALAGVVAEREAEGWPDEALVPLVVGLAELQPWVRQWHNETDPTYQVNLADFLDEQLRSRSLQVGMTLEELAGWRPAPATRGRKAKA